MTTPTPTPAVFVPPQSRRILTLQRQLRTLGRIRTGWSESTGRTSAGGRDIRRAVRSPTFILTATQEDNIRAAAERWGGVVDRWKPQGASPEVWRVITEAEAIDAILPPGDPLSQYNEYWSGGGCVRRCDGVTEQQTKQPCVCLAQFGEKWYERKPTEVCKPTSRLNVFLDLPDFGYWRVETHSFYAAMELAGTVDLIKGMIGYQYQVPVGLRIDPRVVVKEGKGTPFPVVVVEMRGQVGQMILAGVAPKVALPAQEDRVAIEAGPGRTELAALPPAVSENHKPAPVSAGQAERTAAPPRTLREAVDRAAPTPPDRPGRDDGVTQSFEKLIAEATTDEQMRALWNNLIESGASAEVKEAWRVRRTAIRNGTAAVPETVEVVDAEAEPDREEMWSTALRLADKLGWNTTVTSQRFREEMGKDPAGADGFTHYLFVAALKEGRIK